MPDVAAVTRWLEAEFNASLPDPVINEVVAQCRFELCASPRAALPELLYRLARLRLQALVGAGAETDREVPAGE